jgi:CheY-like chemotaxis protein
MRKPLILVVEDEPEMAKNIAAVIESTGKYETFIAHDGAEGLTAIENHKSPLGLANNHIKCVVLDIRMPKMDGLEFLKELRRGESCLQLIPVIMLTAYEDRDKWSKATSPTEGMAAAYLKKPIDEEELIKAIERCVFDKELGAMIDETRKKKYERLEELKEEKPSP